MQRLASELLADAQQAPDRVVVIDADGQHRLGSVMEHARYLAGALADALDGAPTVIVQADNSWRTLAAVVAVGMRGGVVSVISGRAARSEYEIALEDIRPDAVVAPSDTLSIWQADETFRPSVNVLDGWTLCLEETDETRGVTRWQGGCVIALTSGSTGRPKAVVQSESSLRYAGESTIDAVGLGAGDPVGAFVPFSSVAAICFGLYLPAMLRSPIVCLQKWSPEEAVELLRDHQVAWTMLVPTMALQVALVPTSAGALSAMQAMTVGGGPMDFRSLREAEAHLGTKFLRVFGMSECLGHTTPKPADPAEIRLDRDGRPFAGTEVRVVDTHGRPLPRGEVGHAQVRGPSLLVGYARNGVPKLPKLTSDGFLPTGDRARINDDGTVSILGREKQVIIRGGRNLDINEMELALLAIDGVAQVCVVPVPDPLLGERAAALIVFSGTPLALDDVRRELESAEVPKHNWPEFIHAVPHLPLNRVGKLDRPGATALAGELSQRSPVGSEGR